MILKKMIICFIYLFVPLLLHAQVTTTSHDIDSRDFRNSVNDAVQEFIGSSKVPGLSIAVVKDEDILVNKAYGYSNLENEITATTATLYQVASVSKIFAGTGLIKMVEQDKIDLEASINYYLPYLPKEWEVVKVKHAISHTSGLPNLLDSLGDPIGGGTVADAWELVQTKPLKYQPGAQWEYSQMGPHVIRKIIEKVNRASYEDLIRQRIFMSLNMQGTCFINQQAVPPVQATGYQVDETGALSIENFEKSYDYYIPTAAGIYTSTDDLINYHQALINDQLMTEHSKEQMWTPVPFEEGPNFNYGIGWVLDEQEGHQRVWHSGGGKAIFMHFPEKDLSVIVLTNLVNQSPNELATSVASLYLGY